MKSILIRRIALTWVVLFLCLAGCQDPAEVSSEDPDAASDTVAGIDEEPEPEGRPVATLETSEGVIKIKLLPEHAPKTVENFIELAQLGFYNRMTFHRVMPNRMIQGGDPLSRDNNPYNDGQGGSGRSLEAEFSDLPFRAGTVAMAREAGDPNSASSQFFIVLERVPGWDGEYTVFGEVTEGLDVATAISRTPTSDDPRKENRPTGTITINNIDIEYVDEEDVSG